jgi:UDP-glucose 4-epimerase
MPQFDISRGRSLVNVLVTGGAGYVGSIATERLLRAGHRVTVYDNLSHGKPRAVPAGVDLIVGDIADRECPRPCLPAIRNGGGHAPRSAD